jgi:hypothetical protein
MNTVTGNISTTARGKEVHVLHKIKHCAMKTYGGVDI